MNQTIESEDLLHRNGQDLHKRKGYNYWHPINRRHILTPEQVDHAIKNYKET